MAHERLLIRAGTVLTMDPAIGDLTPGEVLIEDGAIAAVAPRLEAGDAELIDLENSIVLPGFVDTHRHTWQAPVRNVAADWTLGHYMTGVHNGLSRHFRPQDTYLGNLLGTVEALNSGITTLLDWSHNLGTPEHADAAVQGLMDSGARAIFAHGGGAAQWCAPLPSAVPHWSAQTCATSAAKTTAGGSPPLRARCAPTPPSSRRAATRPQWSRRSGSSCRSRGSHGTSS